MMVIVPTGKQETAKCFHCKTIYITDENGKHALQTPIVNSTSKVLWKCMVCSSSVEFHKEYGTKE